MRLIDADALLNNTILNVFHAPYITKMDVQSAPTISGWISVKDGTPPEMYKAVLGYAPYHNNIWAVTMRENGEWYIWSPQSKRYDPDWEGPITHWMPMPEPPEEVRGDAD